MNAIEPTTLEADAPDTTTGILQATVELAQELRETVHDQLRLVGLECDRAARSLVVMLAAQVAIGTLLVSTWLALIGAGVFALIDAGLGPTWALMVAAGMMLAGVLVPYLIIARQRQYLRFPATLASLKTPPEQVVSS